MREEMTHERCSELLLPYRRGELPAALSGQVGEHLGGCSACSRELEGLGALVTGFPDVELDDIERRRLHAGLRAALEGESVAILPATENWGRRAAPLLAAAALVALVAVGMLVWPGVRESSSDLSTAGGDSTTESSEESLADQDAAGPAVKAEPEAVGGAPRTESLEARGREAPQADSAQDSAPQGGAGGEMETESVAGTLAFGAAPVITDEPYANARFEPSSLFPPRFPRIGASQASYVQRLTRNSGDAAVAALIRTCIENLSAGGSSEWLPTLATYYRADEILVIGFVRPVRASRILEYELRGWHRDCDHPAPIYRSGRLS